MIPSVDPAAITTALERFDRELRGAPDWVAWEENKAFKYAVVHEGRHYPVKTIISLATGVSPNTFSGGQGSSQANDYIRHLGFTVVPLRPRNPPWTRDELILALDLYMRHRGSPPGRTHPEVLDLSNYLNTLGHNLGRQEFKDYRNPDGVALKLMNFRRLDPEYTSTGKVGMTHGNKDEKEVWKLFADDPVRLRGVADAIKGAVAAGGPDEDGESDADGDTDAVEGRILTRLHRSRERNRKLVLSKKAKMKKLYGRLTCEACTFDFEARYGDRGQDFIECHHTKPVYMLKPGDRTHLDDLRLLCSNCHRMVHVRQPWLDVQELRNILKINRPKV
jgi:5-methylcytosine-specific restriction protein A